MNHESQYYKDYPRWLRHAHALGYDSVNRAIRELYEQECSTLKVSKCFDVCGPTIAAHLKRMGIVRRRGRGGANNHQGRAPKHYVEGVPLPQWCIQHNRKYSTIMMRIKNGMGLQEAIL